MFERAKIASSARASVIRACWPLSIVWTVRVCAAVLTMCCVNEKQSDSSQTVIYGKGCVSKDFFSSQHTISTLQALMQMVGVATRFSRMAHHTETRRYVIVARCSKELIGMSTVCVAVTVVLIGYLLSCGDVEPNPGPGGGSEDNAEFTSGAANSSLPAQSSQASLDRLHPESGCVKNGECKPAAREKGRKTD